jgi:hypothetical protein
MQNVSDIFDKLGGPAAVAKLLDCQRSAASEMKRRGSIPVKYWPRLIDATHGELTPELLMRANAADASHEVAG